MESSAGSDAVSNCLHSHQRHSIWAQVQIMLHCIILCRYIIPCVAFNIYYQGKPERQAKALFKPTR